MYPSDDIYINTIIGWTWTSSTNMKKLHKKCRILDLQKFPINRHVLMYLFK